MTRNKNLLTTLGYAFSITFLFLFWLYMHIYRLADVPAGLHIDEAGMAYDAFCLANWGVDRYLNPYPLYFYNLGGGQSAAYVYLCTLCIKLFGMDTWVFRLPAVLFSLITILCSSLIVLKCFNKKWALLNAFLFCLLPYFTMQSRFGLDCNLMLGAAAFCIYMTILTLEKDRTWMYPLLGLCWGFALYTYVLSYVVFPLFLVMVFLYLLITGKITLKKCIITLIPMCIIAIPLIAMVIINVFDLETIYTNFFTIYKLQNTRVSEFSFQNIFTNFTALIKMLFTCDSAPFDALDKYYTLYAVSIPVCAVGFLYGICKLVTGFRKKNQNQVFDIMLFMTFYLIAQLFTGSIKTSVAIYHMNGVYVALLFFLITGFYAIFSGIQRIIKKKIIPHLCVTALLAVYLINFAGFHQHYFNEYPDSIYSYYLFSPRLNEVLDVFDIKTQTYPTYIDAYYLYYMIEKRVDPHLAQIPQEGLSSWQTLTFQAPNSGLPVTIDLNTVYVINRWNVAAINILNEYPFVTYWTDDYIVYYK